MRFLHVQLANLQVALAASRSADFARFPAGLCIQNIFIYRLLACDRLFVQRREAALLWRNNPWEAHFSKLTSRSAPMYLQPVLYAFRVGLQY
jgi:hypothetical protein